MKANIRDREALLAVSPSALSAYARAAGWTRGEPYGDRSDVYAAEGLPEVILPRTQRLGDYAAVVSRLIEIFAKAADTDELSLYRDLVTADRDVIRVRVAPGGDDGSMTVNNGVNLVGGAHALLLAAACSLREPRPLYRAGANREANNYVNQVRLGQTEQGSYVVTLLTPVVPPPMQQVLDPNWASDDDPIERRMTWRLNQALTATREATERTIGGESNAFSEAVRQGTSANLCEALVTLMEPFPTLDISLTWARTRPMNAARSVVRFANADAPILREAARSFRDREPQPDVCLVGLVQRLKRDEWETDGAITLRAYVAGRIQSVTTVLKQSDYEQAIHAHKTKAPVVVKGELERFGQRWRLLNPSLADVILNEDTSTDGE